MSAIDYWSELAQGGRLLDRKALEQLPEPRGLGSTFADRLRDALTQLPEERSASGETLSKLLDFVLEDTCGLAAGWAKGPAVSAGHSEQLVDGTELKPRRLLTREGQQVLAVFTTIAERIGLHQGRRPLAHAIEYLRRKKTALGLVTNGQEWRLVFADSDNLAWVQWSAERWLDGDKLHPALELFRRVLSVETLTPDKEAASPRLIELIRATRRGQATLSAELGERVRAAVELLLRSRRPVLEPVWASQDPKSVYVAACHFVMRLVVVLFAEARELLPVDSPIYHHAYGVRGLMEALERAGVDRRKARTSAWPRLLGLFRLIHGGSLHPQLLVTAYGGDLFRAGDADGDAVQKALSVLESTAEPPADDVIYDILTLLTRTTERVREGAGWRTVAAPVDFTELTSEYIGILYEGLLDYELRRADQEPVVFLGLGEQPALPLDRLEQMDDKQLSSLVERAKLKKKAADEEEEEAEEDAEEGVDEGREEADPAGAVAAVEALLPGDDQRLKAWERAVKWAERAATAGKLIKAPKTKAATQDPAWKAQLDATAKALIAGLKLPGEFYLVRWGGTRKGAGTFYTRPQLTLPTVRRTLEPLLHDAEGRVRKPEELLALKVCDPAMGSGSFLVAAIRVLTDKVIEALHAHGRIEVVGDHVHLACELLPDADCEQPEDRVEAIVRRAVVEHCIYGVDLDPLAVELARVALWVETLDRRLPFTFLDHKLRCGDALVGTWLDRFRDYPLLAWSRQSPDEKWRGVHHKADQWAKTLKEKRKAVVSEQADLLSGQRSLLESAVTDEAIRTAIERVRALYRRLRKVPSSQPDKRAEIWKTQVAPDPALARVREAFDTWSALWFWPPDRIDDAPTPKNLLAPPEGTRAVVRSLRDRHRFFHWELEFPDVFTDCASGFDAVVGNPPWETQKPSSKEFFSNRDPLYRSYGKQEAIARQREMFEADPELERAWLKYSARFKDAANLVRYAADPFGGTEDGSGKTVVTLVARRPEESRRLHAKWSGQRSKRNGFADPEHPYRHQGSADLNTYKLFIEQSLAIARTGGQVGLLAPNGLYTDKGAMDLRRLLLERCCWRWLYGFENRDRIFDIHRSFKFAVIIASKGGPSTVIRAAFMRHEVEDWAAADGALAYPVERIKEFSPTSLSILEIRNDRDLEVMSKIYANAVLIGDATAGRWPVRYVNDEFHITKQSALFPPRPLWEQKGFKDSGFGYWQGPDGQRAVPLVEGRFVTHFDPFAKGWVSGKGRTAEWRSIPWPLKRCEPQYLMSVEDSRTSGYGPMLGARVVFKKVGSATNARSLFAAVTARWPTCDSAPLLHVGGGDLRLSLALVAALNSPALDFTMRARLGAVTITWQYLAETAVPAPAALEGVQFVSARLSLSHASFAPEWLNLVPEAARRMPWKQYWAVTPAERMRLRCILDAVIALRYGLSRAELRWILRDCDHPRSKMSDKRFCRELDPKGFWRVDKDQAPELRQPVLTLVAFDELLKEVSAHHGDVERAVRSFVGGDGAEGWLLPESLRLTDYELGHDDRANVHQPLASVLGDRFAEWQCRESVEESWRDCESCARLILGQERFAEQKSLSDSSSARAAAEPTGAGSVPARRRKSANQGSLF